MHELRRLVYLDALGVDGFISRRQLPGAASTRRLGLARPAPAVPPPPPPVDPPEPRQPTRSTARPAPAPASSGSTRASPPEQFTLATVLAGEWLWLEDLGRDPLAREQVWLIQGMARALIVAGSAAEPGAGVAESPAPDVALFQWPIHTNDQFDLGPESAQASATSFVARRVQQGRCRGVVCMGADSGSRLVPGQLEVPVIAVHGTLDILADPSLKPVVWRALAPLLTRGQVPRAP